jgi:hypothetical protein
MTHEGVYAMLLVILACCGLGMVISACAQFYALVAM